MNYYQTIWPAVAAFLCLYWCVFVLTGANGPRQDAGLLSESLIWSYVVQLSSALRTIHAHGLACRVMDPTKIIVTGKST